MSVKPNGLHHLAISTGDMKAQLDFFTQVMGLELVGLFWMHGVEGAWHSFLKLDDTQSLSFVYMPGNEAIESVPGQTHAATGAEPSAPGTMQHVSLNVDSEADLLAMRDRIRSHGVPVFGPADHGLCKSIYFAGPEGLLLEVATSDAPIDPQMWIDPEVVALAGITEDELAAMKDPRWEPTGPVPQPAFNPASYHMGFPKPVYDMMLAAPDAVLEARMSFSEPPVKPG